MNHDSDPEFLKRVRAELERSATALDELTVARLRAARRRALEAGARGRAWFVAGGVAAGVVVATVLAMLLSPPAGGPPVTAGLEQLEMLADADLDLYNDLEFYRWLAEHPDAG
jgi:hypothetical protein